MSKIIAFSCPHIKFDAPTNRKENYGLLVLEKIEWLFNEAERRDANLVCVGDLFDKKQGTTFRELYSLIKILEKNKKRMYFTAGNHDLQAYRADYSTQPIGILIESGLIKHIKDNDELDFENGVVLTASNYKANYECEETYSRSVKNDCLFHIHLTHGMLVNKSVPFEATMASEVEPILNCDLLINGHNHEPWEYGDRIYNVGSVARIAKDKNYLNKQPKCLYVDGVTREIEWIDIPVERDVWINNMTRESIDSEALDSFVESFNKKNLSDDDILDELLKGKSEAVCEKTMNYLGE